MNFRERLLLWVFWHAPAYPAYRWLLRRFYCECGCGLPRSYVVKIER